MPGLYNQGMPNPTDTPGWNILPPETVAAENRLSFVRGCSDFAAGLLDRFPAWQQGLNQDRSPDVTELVRAIQQHGLDSGLRRFRNRTMLRIVWRDLCGLASLAETFQNLTSLAEICLQTVLEEHQRRLEEKHGVPRSSDGEPQRMFVIGLGKFGGGELNLSSDIDIIFCFPRSGHCDGRRELSNDQFFTRQARAVIASLSEITEEGFCFRVDTRLRPFGNAGPLTSSRAALEQYYQREGRDWERYALIKARPVAGDLESGRAFIRDIRPFVYRRYIDYSSVEALQEMHANVQEDARRKDRLDDIKRGPGGIREIEFLAQCFQILRGGREPSLQTPSLDGALREIGRLGLLEESVISEVRHDYTFLRFLENRIQALRDQQTHRVPLGEDRERVARAMYEDGVDALEKSLLRTRDRVSDRFRGIFPAQPVRADSGEWAEQWRGLRRRRQEIEPMPEALNGPLEVFVRRLERVALSQRADQRLDRFMPELLGRLDQRDIDERTLNRVFDLVLAISRRSAYLVLLVQHPKALDRMLDLFARSEWVADKVIRFPALLDELIDPSLGSQTPSDEDLRNSIDRILLTAQDTESTLEAFNYLKLATELRIAVGQLQENLPGCSAQQGLSALASALLRGVLILAGDEIRKRHGSFSSPPASIDEAAFLPGNLAVIAYGTLGACELGYGSDLDIVFLFEPGEKLSSGKRPLPPEQYYARLAQRVLSFLTIMTPSGRLYEVDTRLRPNGRAGSLVSSVDAFRDYQMSQAWTWELQALTRARFVAGSPSLEAAFNRVRLDVLCQGRDEVKLAGELAEMRRKMSTEHESKTRGGASDSLKQRPGGLIDIEFVAQLGVLASARLYPRVIRATSTTQQITELAAIAWLSEEEAGILQSTMDQLRQQKLMASLVTGGSFAAIDTEASARVFSSRLAVQTSPS
jgi:glutamate-ammonia-ligase adenylyltransferase